jgi:hypothetical protein
VTDYSFSPTLTWDLGGSMQLARSQRVDVLDPATGTTAPDLKQDGQPVSWVTSDTDGVAAFTSTLPKVRLMVRVGNRSVPFDVSSIDAYSEAVAAVPIAQAAADDAAAARDEAASSASSSAASAALVGAPAGAAIDAHVGPTLVSAGTGDQTAALNAFLAASSPAGVKRLIGDFTISGSLAVPSDTHLNGTRATITQTANLTPVFVVNNATNVRIQNVKALGKTSDYTNGNGVYTAAAVRVLGTSSDVQIDGCVFLGMAGAGVYLAGTTSSVRVRNCRMTGAGPTYITGTSFNYSGGIVTETGATKWQATGNDISGFAQGIVTGDNMQDIVVTGNYIHDIPGQHGLYLETVNGAVISGNIVRSCALLGMKIQVGALGVNDADAVTISDNVFTSVGAQGILLTNPVAGSTAKLRRISVTGNVIRTAAGNGIEANNCVGLHVSDNIMYDVANGIQINTSQGVEVFDNRVNKTTANGITLTDVTDAILDTNRILDPSSSNLATAEFGIQIAGSTSADLTLRHNKITDTLGNMRYGVYVSAGDQTTMDFIGNRSTGATDYGFRGVASTACREWRDNDFQGTTARHLNAPTSGAGRLAPQAYGTAAPTTGAHIVGEVVWNSAPAASGTIGWVCTTAGTPGTWKTFGAISA